MRMENLKDMKAVFAAQQGDNASAVGYKVVANAMPSTQEQAPFLGRTSAAGSCSQDELAERMVKAGCQMPVAEIKRVWNGTGEYLVETMPESPRAFDVGFMRVWPVIGGTFTSADAEFDPERNAVYVAVAPSVAVRDALSGGAPSKAGGAVTANPQIGNVTWNGTDADTIKSGVPFTIVGSYLTVTAGDEYAELLLPEGAGGGSVPVTLSAQVSVDDGKQRLSGSLARPVETCDGATLVVYTHGANPSSRLLPTRSDRLTVLAGDVPPGPTAPTLTEINGGGSGETIYSTSFELGGTNLTDATLKFSCEDTHGETVERSVTPESVTATAIVVPNDWDRGVAIPDQGDVTFTVTTGGGSAQIHGTYHA